MTTSLPALSEALPRASGWAMAACFGLSLLFLVGFVAPSPHADDWGSLATISSTMGVQEGRLCLGESTRGDLGCPAYAPYVAPIGWVGIGTFPASTLDVSGTDMMYRMNGQGRFRFTADAHANYIQSAPNDGSAQQFRDLAFTPYMTSTLNSYMIIKAEGLVGISTSIPQTKLDIRGSLRLAAETSTTLQPCDPNRTGAIKYQTGDFHYCRNGTSWESLTSLTGGGGSAGDRLISGTTQAIAYQNTSLSLVTAGTERMVIGTNGNVGIGSQPTTAQMTVYTSSSLANGFAVHNASGGTASIATMSLASNAGSGALNYYSSNFNAGAWAQPNTLELVGYSTTEAIQLRSSSANGFIRFMPAGSTERMRIVSSGLVGIGTATPTTKLEVAGTVSATTLQLADNPSNPCNAANKGMAKVIDGRIYVCRYP